MTRPPRRSLASRLLLYVGAPALLGTAIGFALLPDSGAAAPSPPPVVAAGGGFADAVERAAPAVVNIHSLRAERSMCDLPQYQAFCQRFGIRQRRRLASSLGSGVMVREDGHILTNYHVIANADDIVVQFSDGEQAPAAVVGKDRDTDLALLKVSGSGFPVIEPAANVRVGDFVLAIGNPFGIGQAVSLGIVSAKGRTAVAGNRYDDFIQTDAAVNPGNSGGALVDVHGRLVGINTLIYSQGGGSDGVGFAIPADRAVAVLGSIVEHGKVLRGFLGVALADSSATLARGLDVLHVYPGTPADRAGLRRGDVLLAINGEAADSPDAVRRRIGEQPPESRLALRIWRNGAVRRVEATAGVRPET